MYINFYLAKAIQTEHLREARQNRLARQMQALRKKQPATPKTRK